MAEFASKGVAGAGLGTGIAGLALGVLNSSNNGNGLLGGLLGGGNQNVVSALQAENSMLKAENYSDKNAKEVYMQSLTDNRRLRDETFAYLKPLSDEAANNRVELAKLQAELKCCCEKQELLEAIEKRNKETYHTEGDIRTYKDALKALYYLISIEKSK
jgi:hypothetical protein